MVAAGLVTIGRADVAGAAPVEIEVVTAGLGAAEVVAAGAVDAGAVEVAGTAVEVLHPATTKLLTSKITSAINKPFISPFLPNLPLFKMPFPAPDGRRSE